VAGPSPEEYLVPLERTLDGRLGFEVLEAGPAHARARVEVTDAVRRRPGIAVSRVTLANRPRRSTVGA
jgi:hypothetical protein